MSTTFKQGAPDAGGDSKIGFEAKFKSVTGETAHEAVIKQDGSASYEIKTSIDVSALMTNPPKEMDQDQWPQPHPQWRCMDCPCCWKDP